MHSVKEQLRRNTVALISLIVAVSSLGYNTWRNEKTEANRNIRTAAIEALLLLGELDRVNFLAQFNKDPMAGDPKLGWAYVLTIRDMGVLLPDAGREATAALHGVWSQNADEIATDRPAYDRVSDSVERTRETLLEVLRSLD